MHKLGQRLSSALGPSAALAHLQLSVLGMSPATTPVLQLAEEAGEDDRAEVQVKTLCGWKSVF